VVHQHGTQAHRHYLAVLKALLLGCSVALVTTGIALAAEIWAWRVTPDTCAQTWTGGTCDAGQLLLHNGDAASALIPVVCTSAYLDVASSGSTPSDLDIVVDGQLLGHSEGVYAVAISYSSLTITNTTQGDVYLASVTVDCQVPTPTPGAEAYPAAFQPGQAVFPIFNPEPPPGFSFTDQFWQDPSAPYGLLWWAGVTLNQMNAENLLFLIGTLALVSVVLVWMIQQVRNPPE
jgi:hypothetical protein